ncbi:MAG: hypothetical protein ACI96M_002037 [Candidatus Azotimanducaceae bacterium]|jgi:hypothetical protein
MALRWQALYNSRGLKLGITVYTYLFTDNRA